jgi:integrase
MQKIMEIRLADYKERGFKGESAVNYEVRYLSAMITWGLNFEPEVSITENPLHKLEMIKAPQNERYVTHQEYWAQYNISPPLLRAFYEVQYLCACRAIEVRQLRESDDLGDKLLIKRTKGSKHNYIRVSERLRAAIESAKELRPKQKITVMGEDRHIFCNANGESIKREGLKSAMGRVKAKMGAGFWSLHLLKSKGLTDAKDKDMAGLTDRMKNLYDKQIASHDAVE